jgi:hypothetical protein
MQTLDKHEIVCFKKKNIDFSIVLKLNYFPGISTMRDKTVPVHLFSVMLKEFLYFPTSTPQLQTPV